MAGSGLGAMREGQTRMLEVRNLTQEFAGRRRGWGKFSPVVQAVSDVSFDVLPGEALGIVGESGCGKSTTMRALLQAPRPTGGKVVLDGVDVTGAKASELRRLRRDVQLIMQDPHGSLDPRWEIKDLIEEPLRIQRVGDARSRKQRVEELLDLVGLDPVRFGGRRPHELSGGQSQRVAIARALALNPKLILCDEPVSALDVSVQAQILNLLEQLRTELALTSVFISHDLSVVKHVSDRVVVMYLGKICEVGPAEDLYRQPAHPYTAALMSSIPVPDPTLEPSTFRLGGDLPSPLDPPSGCRFRTRCPNAQQRCTDEEPLLRPFGPEHVAACHFPVRSEQERAAHQTRPDPVPA